VDTDFLQITACGLPNMKLRRPIPCALIVPLRAPRASHCTTAAVPTTLVRVRARSEAPTTHSGHPHSQSIRRSRASARNQLRQEDRLYTGRSALEEDELLRPTLDTDTFDEENKQQRQEEGDRLLSSSSEHGRRGSPLFSSTHLSDPPGRDESGRAGEDQK
jgi:hypothetical protein